MFWVWVASVFFLKGVLDSTTSYSIPVVILSKHPYKTSEVGWSDLLFFLYIWDCPHCRPDLSLWEHQLHQECHHHGNPFGKRYLKLTNHHSQMSKSSLLKFLVKCNPCKVHNEWQFQLQDSAHSLPFNFHFVLQDYIPLVTFFQQKIYGHQ